MESLGFLMNDIARLQRRRFDSYARTLGVTRAQWQVMFGLSRNEGINQAGLAERLEIENITLCRIIDRLQEAGLVERRADPNDRRAWRLYLTAKAQPVMAKLKAIADQVQSEVLYGLSATEQTQLIELLTRVRVNAVGRPPEAANA